MSANKVGENSILESCCVEDHRWSENSASEVSKRLTSNISSVDTALALLILFGWSLCCFIFFGFLRGNEFESEKILSSYAYARTEPVIKFNYHTIGFDFILCTFTMGFSMERIMEYMTALFCVLRVYFTIMFVQRVISVRELREYEYTDGQYTEAQYTDTRNLLQYTVKNTGPKDNVSWTCTYGE